MAGPMGGAIFVTAVLSEIVKTLTGRGEDPRVFFWRTSAGAEVDFLVEVGDRLIPVEVKLSSTPLPSMATVIGALRQDLGDKVGSGYVVHGRNLRLPLGSSVTAITFADL